MQAVILISHSSEHRFCQVRFTRSLGQNQSVSDICLESLKSIGQVRVIISTFFEHFLELALADSLGVTLLQILFHLFAASFTWSNKCFVLQKSFASQRAIENFDRLNCHSWSNFNEHELLDVVFFREFLFVLVHDLVGAEPDAVVVQLEGKDMVYEGLAFWVVLWSVKHLAEKFFNQLQVH